MNNPTYWTPDPLPLPPYTKILYWTKGVLDSGVAWFLVSRALYHNHKTPSYHITQEEMDSLLFVRKRDRHYNLRLTQLPFHRIEDFLFVDVGKIDKHAFAFSEPEGRDLCILVFKKDKKGWILYPRSLRSSSWQTKVTTLFKNASCDSLFPTWRQQINALPDYALTIFDKYNGLPYRFGTAADLPYEKNKEEGWWNEHNHPFWQHAKHSLLAMVCLETLALPEPISGYKPTFMWSVVTKTSFAETNSQAPLTLEPSIPFYGYSALKTEEDDIPVPTAAQSRSLERINRVMKTLIAEKMPLEETPYMAENCVGRLSLHKPASSFEIHTRGHFMPWIPHTDIERTRSAHDALHWLSKLPEDWNRDVLALLTEDRNTHP